MDTNKLRWLRGPLPPISESILMSGLVSSPPNSSTPSNDLNNQKVVFQSAPVAVSKPVKRPLKLSSLPKPKGDPHNLAQLKTFNPPPIINPEVQANYRPPPLDESALKLKKPSVVAIPKENLTEKVLNARQSNLREFIEGLKHELDANIASVVPISPEAVSPEQQFYIKTQILQFYNFAFNKLILNEKSVSSDKAILLRRFMKFYNQISDEFQPIIRELQEQKEVLNSDISEFKEEIEQLTNNIVLYEEKLKRIEDENKQTKEQLDKVVDESNNKDIQISSASYDLDMLKSQLNQLQFRYNQREEEKKSLENVLIQRDKEIKGQLDQIEGLTQKIAEFQQGETGYIIWYHQEKARAEELDETILELKQKIYNLENIEKASIGVDTTDLPVKKGRKKKFNQTTPVSVPVVEESLSSKKLGAKIHQQASSGSFHRSASKNRLSACASRASDIALVLFSSQEVQTDAASLTNPLIIDLTTDFAVFSDNESILSFNSVHTAENSVVNNQLITKDYEYPEGYDIVTKLQQIPDLHKFIMPFFSDVYIAPIPVDLKILNLDKVQVIVKNEKPLIWGLQLIHNFLTDPFIRSTENKSRISNEVIIVDWISKQYKVQHLVNQVIADFVRILTRYRNIDEMVTLFCDILEGNYNLSQLCFLATIYSFTCSLTFPDLTEEFQNYDITPSQDLIKIHITAVHKIYSVCFSHEIANSITSSLKDEMVTYINFLKDITAYFGDKHHQISNQARDLLTLCGCIDPRIILYDVFESVMVILGNTQNIKNDWKSILNKKEDRSAASINLTELLGICADREKPLMNLLNIVPLKQSIINLKSLSQFIYDLFREFVVRYSRILPHVMTLLSDPIKGKIENLINDFKTAILRVDMPQIIWTYRQLLSKIDRLTMKEKGFIPFHMKSNNEVIMQLKEYMNRAESVAFALIEA